MNDVAGTAARVSVIVPVYKAQATLARCAQSILAQTYGAVEHTISKVAAHPYERCYSLREYHPSMDLAVHILLKFGRARLLNQLLAAHYCGDKCA